MRLLYIDQTGDLRSRYFLGKDVIPPYAILSHRWLDSEVLFEDIGNGTYKKGKGWSKILFCAARAEKDGIQYFWVDTCCIDKWNLSELNWSINSMFRWYKNAVKCYVYLSDVSVPTAMVAQKDWEAAFRASEWFRRGWTLQELLAPQSVEFFSAEGQHIGDKKSLERLIAEITCIPMEALRNCSLDEYSVSERLSWVQSRETTEEEDIVYCLFGILNVSMPTCYGEGREKARRRLEVELGSSAPSVIPFFRNDRNVGHESKLAELEAKLFGDAPTGPVAIVGPRGTGKSQLALEFAYRIRDQRKNCSVFWVDAGSRHGLHLSYTNIAQKLEIPGWEDHRMDIANLVKVHLARGLPTRSLLVFDNAEDVNLQSTGNSKSRTNTLVDYLPLSDQCSILLTSTNESTASTLKCQNILRLQNMDPDTATRCLEYSLNAPMSKDDWLEAEPLLQDLSYFPLAITQAAAYINTQNIKLQDYRSQLTAFQTNEPDLQSYEATTLISVQQIHRDNPLAADYLYFAACLDRRDILLELLDAPSPREREASIRLIDKYKLITRRPAESAIDLHRLVHDTLRGWLQKETILHQWTQKAIKKLSIVSIWSNRSKRRRILPHARFALSQSPREQEDVEKLELMLRCARALYVDYRFHEAESLLLQFVELRSRLCGAEDYGTLRGLWILAEIYRLQARWNDAKELTLYVHDKMKKILSKDHPTTLLAMLKLAMSYIYLGQLKEAEELRVQVSETVKKATENETPFTIEIMSTLARTYFEQARYEEAETLYVSVLESARNLLSDEDNTPLRAMYYLAHVLRKRGCVSRAVECMEKCNERQMVILGPDHPETASTRMYIAKWRSEIEEVDK